MFIAKVGIAQPPHRYEQEQLVEALTWFWSKTHHNTSRVRRFHESVQVGARHLALSVPEYLELKTFGDANDAFIRVGTDVGEQAVRAALDGTGLGPADVDAIYFVTVTGVATPSIDARLVGRLGLRPDVKRVPIFGLGCVAGAAGIGRLNDYLVGHPDEVALLLSVELCSLTMQRGDFSVPNLIASGLFGDGAACAVGVGARRAQAMGLDGGPRVLASKSSFYPGTERVMGWDIGADGFKIVLSATVPDIVRANIGRDVDGFLTEQGLTRADIGVWVSHPGGPKVLQAFEESLDLHDGELGVTWDSLRQVGNLSSASVLFVLQQTMANQPAPGSYGLMMAMGPGFCAELVLLRW